MNYFTLTYQIPSSILFMHQWSTRITLTRILTTTSISCTQHFRINDYIDSISSMPSFANSNRFFKLSKISKFIWRKVLCEFFHLFSITGTSTACKVFGRKREPGFNAPHPAAQPNFPRKSSFFSGKQMGAEISPVQIFGSN